MNPVPLFTLLREKVPEIAVFGEIVVVDGKKTIFQSADAIGSYPARSLLKPFQFLATKAVKLGSKEEWRIPALGSISANEEQIRKVEQWLRESDRKELVDKMILPATYPLDENHRVLLKRSQKEPSRIYHMCFSKHLNILDKCKDYGWDLNSYHHQEHPFHQNLKEILENTLEADLKRIRWVKDGCGLPSPTLLLTQIAQLFQKLMNEKDQTDLKEVRELMINHPDWIGGIERVDSELISSNRGSVVAKEGADGLLAIGVSPTKEFPRGLGIVLKLASGYQPAFSALALNPIFEKLGIQYELKPLRDQTIQFHYEPWKPFNTKIFDLSPTLSAETAVWPGDTSFKQEVQFHVERGDHLSLSSIKTTLHIGSHTDAPNHFGKNKKGIDEVELTKYRGLCSVISVQIPPGQEIKVQDLQGKNICAKRVLFKTGSYSDPKKFNEKFNSLSAEVISYLSAKGVCLVGIDTPSIDLFDSKDLPSHQETLKSGMAILEGIDLSAVAEGIYELNALPLKIKEGDASPVRAVLISNHCPSEF